MREAGTLQAGATIFAYPVARPENYAVVVLDREGRVLSLEGKRKIAKSNLAVPGLYFYDESATCFAKTLKPSDRGELEITDLNRIYLERRELSASIIGRGTAWLDGGTPETLFEAGQFVRVIEQRTSLKIAGIEEVAYRTGFISIGQLAKLAEVMTPCSYRAYLNQIAVQETTAEQGLSS